MSAASGGLAMSEAADEALAGLVVDVAELRRDVDDLAGVRGQIKEVARSVAGLRTGLEQLAADSRAAAPRIWSWPALNAAEATEAWSGLRTWLADILLARYPGAPRALLPCWYRHPDVLDSLTALYTAWRGAYDDPKAPADAAAVWLDRWLPAALRQLRESLGSCSDGHDPVVPSGYLGRLLGSDYEAFVAADVVARPNPAT
jgi:hypothetical protein